MDRERQDGGIRGQRWGTGGGTRGQVRRKNRGNKEAGGDRMVGGAEERGRQ